MESEERFSSSQTENSYAPIRTILQEIELEGINSHSVLTQYLSGKVKKSGLVGEEPIIYPFGCNQSQKQAVEQALSTSLSVIQGPPGTGKTQTILNIIANLMIRGKTVAVASNNNAATENVKEKFDIITSRAVAPLKVISGYAAPLLANDGIFVAYKSKRIDDEINDAKSVLKKYRLAVVDIIEYKLPLEDNFIRNLTVIKRQ